MYIVDKIVKHDVDKILCYIKFMIVKYSRCAIGYADIV